MVYEISPPIGSLQEKMDAIRHVSSQLECNQIIYAGQAMLRANYPHIDDATIVSLSMKLGAMYVALEQ